ncbi:hypothetical protein OS128_01115 [Corynebacterium sp. P5848]|uniref:hypothetical protein n=1 Tax=Corynebacterium marambiense TaxID=2765364 RepID=UPI002260F180|nr:hypothetical protein [Corynebacterium marambiense]MCX7541520.1 hypothetical protein [Corynebacterium marambiense]
MSDRRTEDAGVSAGQDDNLFLTDAFLDDLARGVDPSGGDDELAGLLLGLKSEVDAPMPPVPSLEKLGLSDAAPVTTRFAPVEESAVGEPPAADGGAQVLSLAGRRRGVPGFVHGLIGAAAATLVIAGGGTAVYNAEPGSALWGVNTAMFGDHASVVELASTLEEADNRNANGDVAGALELLEQAKLMAKEINARNATKTDADKRPQAPRTVTVTVTPEQQDPPEPATITVTSTIGIPPSAPSPLPAAPSGAPEVPQPVIPPSTSPLPVPDGSGDTTDTLPVPDDGEGQTADNVGEPVVPGVPGISTTEAIIVPGQ